MSFNFAPLVKSLFLAHTNFKETWNKYGIGFKAEEPEEITRARDNFLKALNILFGELDKYNKDFLNGAPYAVDSILTFLETDIPAFRCGYAKEKYYRRLKSIFLNKAQRERLCNLAFHYCSSKKYMREFRDLARLMIKIADKSFVERIYSLKENACDIVKFKSDLMLKTILDNRKDLR